MHTTPRPQRSPADTHDPRCQQQHFGDCADLSECGAAPRDAEWVVVALAALQRLCCPALTRDASLRAPPVLTGNSLSSLSALEPLTRLPHLTHLALLGNPLRTAPHYRAYVVWRLGSRLHTLDFARVRDADRAEGRRLFEAEGGGMSALALTIQAEGAGAVAVEALVEGRTDASAGGKKGKGKGMLSDEERSRIREAIKAAGSVDEVRRLERLLAEGRALE